MHMGWTLCLFSVTMQVGALSSSPSLSRSEPFSTFLRYDHCYQCNHHQQNNKYVLNVYSQLFNVAYSSSSNIDSWEIERRDEVKMIP